MRTKRGMIREMNSWAKHEKFPGTRLAVSAVKQALKMVKQKPLTLGISGQGGMVVRWQNDMYRFKLRIGPSGELNDDVIEAIETFPCKEGFFSRLFKRLKKPVEVPPIPEYSIDDKKQNVLNELDLWMIDDKFPASRKSIEAAKMAIKAIRALPQRLAVHENTGMMMRWDSPAYVCKLYIDETGALDSRVLRAIDLLPEDHSGIYGAGGEQKVPQYA